LLSLLEDIEFGGEIW